MDSWRPRRPGATVTFACRRCTKAIDDRARNLRAWPRKYSKGVSAVGLERTAPTRHDHEVTTSVAIPARPRGYDLRRRAGRIKKQVDSLDGVKATINIATAQAHVDHGDVSVDRLITAVSELVHFRSLLRG